MLHSIQIFVTRIIEKNWESDEDTFLTEKERQFLVGHNAMDYFSEMYFYDLVERYQGSCTSLSWKDEDFLEEFNLFETLDNIQFECTCCGWWYEAGEEGESLNGERYCTDCAEEEE